MPRPLIIENLYVPKVGEGVPMLEALREAADYDTELYEELG